MSATPERFVQLYAVTAGQRIEFDKTPAVNLGSRDILYLTATGLQHEQFREAHPSPGLLWLEDPHDRRAHTNGIRSEARGDLIASHWLYRLAHQLHGWFK